MKWGKVRLTWPLVGAVVAVVALVAGTVAVSELQKGDPPPARAAVTSEAVIPPTIVSVFGDSYTKGAGASADSKRYVSIMARQMCWVGRTVAAASTGYVASTSTDGPYVSRLDQVTSASPDVVIVQGSTNDAAAPPAQVQAAAVSLLGTLKSRLPRARIYVVGPALPPASSAPFIAGITRAVSTAAQQVGVKAFFDPVAERWISADNYNADRLHPNDAGHAEFADGLVRDLRSAGEQRGAGCADPLP